MANCKKCNGTQKIKYKDNDGLTNYHWVPFKEMPCSNCNYDAYECWQRAESLKTN